MSALDQLKERAIKKEVELRRKRKEKKAKERESYRVKDEAFRVTKEIYIEPLASRPPPVFQESNESSGKRRDMESENFETLKCVVIVGEGFEETLRDFRRQTPPMHLHLSLLMIIRKKNRFKEELQRKKNKLSDELTLCNQ
jgi:hypothetical protein